jgi:sugar phosphate isomerase/epimerase
MISGKSFVLSASFPASTRSEDGLSAAIQSIAPYDFSVVEYYSEVCEPERVRVLMEGRRSIFLAGARQKSQGLSLCTLDESERLRAVKALSECMRFALRAGAEAVLITSGGRPSRDEDEPHCFEMLRDSILRLHEAVPDMKLLLEPGDRDIEFCQLIGGTDVAVKFLETVLKQVPLTLTFDMSHVAQLGEDLPSAWNVAKDYCSHVHLANCVLKQGSPLYGDKHPFFGIRDGVYSHDDAKAFFSRLAEDTKPVIVGIEMICPKGAHAGFFECLASDAGWFFGQPGTK